MQADGRVLSRNPMAKSDRFLEGAIGVIEKAVLRVEAVPNPLGFGTASTLQAVLPTHLYC